MKCCVRRSVSFMCGNLCLATKESDAVIKRDTSGSPAISSRPLSYNIKSFFKKKILLTNLLIGATEELLLLKLKLLTASVLLRSIWSAGQIKKVSSSFVQIFVRYYEKMNNKSLQLCPCFNEYDQNYFWTVIYLTD